MTVREIRIYPLYDEESISRKEINPNHTCHTLVEVVSHDGVSGMGSASSSAPLVQASLEMLRPFLSAAIGESPRAASERLRRDVFWHARGGALVHTLSAIDIALWDLAGIHAGQSVSRLIRPRRREEVLPYVTLEATDQATIRDDIQRAKERGFRAFKIAWGAIGSTSSKNDESFVCTAREVAGEDALLAVDAGASQGTWPHALQWAVDTERMLANYSIAWFEEPLPPDNIADFIALRRAASVPIAGGEIFELRKDFLNLIERGAVDIIQPDTTRAGGISELLQIGDVAEEHELCLFPHGWNTAFGFAADLQLAATLRGTTVIEFGSELPFIDQIAPDALRFDSTGHIPIPDQPGLGLCWDREAVTRLSRGESWAITV